jgi:hypothetical protein
MHDTASSGLTRPAASGHQDTMRHEIITRLHLLLAALQVALTVIGFIKIQALPGLAMHWGPDGHPDVLWPRNEALLLFPALALLLILIGLLAARLLRPEDPRRPHLATVLLAGLGLVDALQLGFILIGIGSDFDLLRLIGAAGGVGMLAGAIFNMRPLRDQGRFGIFMTGLLRLMMGFGGIALFWAAVVLSDPINMLAALFVCVLGPPLIYWLLLAVMTAAARSVRR